MPAARAPHQPSFDDLGTPLHEVTFVVVDLETTGGSPRDCRITEFGAVKIRGGEVLGEFQSLVHPGQSIPADISALTGITDGMVARRPPVEAVLPTFLEFCRGTALVAHNAGFDVGFLNAGLARLSYPTLTNPVVCTAQLARRLVRDEVRNCKLATLAQFFSCRTVPVHRALADARATVEVFHGLLERAGSFGVLTLEDLVGLCRAGSAPLFASRRRLADGLPSAPGVYAFRSASGEVLYVGKATDLRSRVRGYFGNDTRRSVMSMMKETDRIDHRVCPTPVEAAVREVRLIQQHRPRFNHRSKQPERRVYVRLTRERFPRLSIVRSPPTDGSPWVGPVSSRRAAERLIAAVHDVVPLRRCTPRIGLTTRFPACALAAMGRCPAPCEGAVSVDAYGAVVASVATAFAGDVSGIGDAALARMRRLAAAGRFEEAAEGRDRLRALVAAIRATRQVASSIAAGVLVVVRPAREHADVVALRDGVLVASRRVAAADVPTVADQFRAAAEAAPAASDPQGPGEEVAVVTSWLHGDGVRVHYCDGTHTSPVAGGRATEELYHRLVRAHRTTGRAAAELSQKRRRRIAQPAQQRDGVVAASRFS
ncbi:MAG: DEDD exonuclease domain-containing protein [Nitriliruptorales bacterium]|nr:DEDD exonuclease domain-containing protein [Nitriliruptorales bacterium]